MFCLKTCVSARVFQAPVVDVVERFWYVFQPLLFGLIGAEIVIGALEISTVCEYQMGTCSDMSLIKVTTHTLMM